jgi:regulatory protein
MRVIKLGIRRKGLYAVRLDEPAEAEGIARDERGDLLIDRAAADEFGLGEGDQITQSELDELAALACYKRAHSRALYLLSCRDYSRRALYDKLARDFGESAAQQVAERMCELGFIDDERYAARLAENMTGQGISSRSAIYKLTAKGISRHVAEAAVESLEVDAGEQLDALIERKYAYKLQGADEKAVARVVNALARRGYSFGDIRSAIARFNYNCEF